MMRTAILGLAACVAAAAPVPRAPDTFVADDRGLALLGPDGKETFRADPRASGGTLSPDRRWLAGLESEKDSLRSALVVRPRGHAAEPVTVPLLWGTTGPREPSGCLLRWSPDGRRLLVMEHGVPAGGLRVRGGVAEQSHAARVFDLGTKRATELKLPDGCWATDWSADGKRLLADVRAGDTTRLTWVTADGGGPPEYLTAADEFARGGRASPDGRRVLAHAGPKRAADPWAALRLCVIDPAAKTRTPIDDPGYADGWCWSPDGTRVAYTWQPTPPAGADTRETTLFTCDADGRNRKAVTRRTYKNPKTAPDRGGAVFFFAIRDWR